MSTLLLDWFDKNGRDLPWRVKGGAHPNPYVILVSELMLQQTTVKTVIPYFERFMKRFPSVDVLAQASLEEVYFYWQGLGYYTRARSLHETARMIMEKFGGVFPSDKKDVLQLKGIGPYTVASFLSLAFNQPEAVVDGNVVRIMCRMYDWQDPVEKLMPIIREKAQALTNRERASDYASAIMDLGAMICTPKNPQCLICPWQKYCLSCGKDNLEKIPNKTKLEKKEKSGFVYVIKNKKQEIFILKRTEKGLLSGLYELPWTEVDGLFEASKKQDLKKSVTHVFSHFKLTLKLYEVHSDEVWQDGFFVARDELKNYAFSTLMKKVLALVK